MGRTKTKTADQPTLIVDNGKTDVAVQKQGQQVAPTDSAPNTLLSIIDRASRDPTVDVDRLERLIGIYERQQASNARTEYNMAMSLAQEEMKGIRANSNNPQTRSKYASYGALDKAIRPIYTKHGFALSFDTGEAPKPDDVRVLCMVSHRGGHMQQHHIDMPADGKGAKGGDVMSRTHATGAAVTYGTRYLAGMVFNLAILKDNDGNDAGERAKDWTDMAIQQLNTTKYDAASLEKWRSENEKGINWLKKNEPDQFERFQIAYSNAAEAAGIKKEEPRRGDKDKTSTAASPHGGPKKGGQGSSGEDDSTAKGDSKSEVQGKPAQQITDVIEFDTFPSASTFLDFSSAWMADPKRTAAEAQQWYDHYREKIDGYLKHEFPNKPKSWIKESMTDTFAVYVQITSAAG